MLNYTESFTRLLYDYALYSYATSTIFLVSISEPTPWLGLAIPHWVGWVFYILGLIYGAMLSVHQDSDVDKYIKNPKLKPYYSAGLALFVTLFGIPLKFDVTVWELILPVIGIAAIGSQIIYYFISSGKFLIGAFMKKVIGFTPEEVEEMFKDDN